MYESTAQQETSANPCDDCPSELDKVGCRAEGVKEQNKYNESKAGELGPAREAYRKARAAYSTARDAARAQVVEARARLDHAVDQIDCLIKDKDVVADLIKAHEWVLGRLAECPGGTSGCCLPDTEDCVFDTGCERTAEALAGRIAAFEDRVAVAKKCFDELIKEPAELKIRVANVVKEIDAIVAALKGDQTGVDYRRLYGRALIAAQDLDGVWHGFADVNAYITCLCRALTCTVKGYDALGELKGAQAEHACLNRAKDACCVSLRANVLEELMAYFLKHSAKGGGAAESTRC